MTRLSSLIEKGKVLLLAGRTGAGTGAGFGTFGRPVFGREGDAPELRARRGKFEADFGFIAANGTEEYDGAFLFFRGAFVLQIDKAATGEARLKKDQRAVGIDRECFGFLFKWLALRILTVKAYGDLHEDTLAAALWSGMSRCGRQDSSLFFLKPILPVAA